MSDKIFGFNGVIELLDHPAKIFTEERLIQYRNQEGPEFSLLLNYSNRVETLKVHKIALDTISKYFSNLSEDKVNIYLPDDHLEVFKIILDMYYFNESIHMSTGTSIKVTERDYNFNITSIIILSELSERFEINNFLYSFYDCLVLPSEVDEYCTAWIELFREVGNYKPSKYFIQCILNTCPSVLINVSTWSSDLIKETLLNQDVSNIENLLIRRFELNLDVKINLYRGRLFNHSVTDALTKMFECDSLNRQVMDFDEWSDVHIDDVIEWIHQHENLGHTWKLLDQYIHNKYNEKYSKWSEVFNYDEFLQFLNNSLEELNTTFNETLNKLFSSGREPFIYLSFGHLVVKKYDENACGNSKIYHNKSRRIRVGGNHEDVVIRIKNIYRGGNAKVREFLTIM